MLKLDYNFLFTILNLLILYGLMKKFLFDKVNAVLIKRKALLDQQFMESVRIKENAIKLKEEYETAVNVVKDESERIVANAKESARMEYDKILKEADSEAKLVLVKAKKNIEWERVKTLHKMKDEVAELAIELATKIIGKNNTVESNREVYDHFLGEVGE